MNFLKNLKNKINILNIILLLTSLTCFAMERDNNNNINNNNSGKKSTDVFPSGVWQEVIEYLKINENGKTEKEIFKNFDALINLGAVDKSLNKMAKEQVKKLYKKDISPEYTYAQFKADIMNDILKKKLGANYKNNQDLESVEYLGSLAVEMDAKIWAKYYKTELYQYLYDSVLMDSFDNIEKALKFGADPNFYPEGKSFKSSAIFLFIFNKLFSKMYPPRNIDWLYISKYMPILSLFLQKGADFNRKFDKPIIFGVENQEIYTLYDLIIFAIEEVKKANGNINKLFQKLGKSEPKVLTQLKEIKEIIDKADKKNKDQINLVNKNKKELSGRAGKEEQK